MFLRIADSEKEPLNTIIDSDDVCIPTSMRRLVKLIPVFNIIYPFWSADNVQLDTVFKSLKHCDTLLPLLESVEKKGRKSVEASAVNKNEELRVIPLQPLKDMLAFYNKYREQLGITLTDNDIKLVKEYFCEFVRRNEFPEKSRRLGSVFFYENLLVADMAQKSRSQRNPGRFCEAEIVETRHIDRYDLRWLTDIRKTCIFKDCLDAVRNYWTGKMTKQPKIEIVFSGKYILKELT